jgi:lipopolysaccharide biosynthesis regulator YciM
MQSFTTAVDLLKRLRAANEKIKNADFANLIADLNLEFADVKMKLAGVIEENLKLKEQIRVLQAVDGAPCPKCRKRTYQLESSRPDPLMGDLGATRRTYKCTACGFGEDKLTVPET